MRCLFARITYWPFPLTTRRRKLPPEAPGCLCAVLIPSELCIRREVNESHRKVIGMYLVDQGKINMVENVGPQASNASVLVD